MNRYTVTRFFLVSYCSVSVEADSVKEAIWKAAPLLKAYDGNNLVVVNEDDPLNPTYVMFAGRNNNGFEMMGFIYLGEYDPDKNERISDFQEDFERP